MEPLPPRTAWYTRSGSLISPQSDAKARSLTSASGRISSPNSCGTARRPKATGARVQSAGGPAIRPPMTNETGQSESAASPELSGPRERGGNAATRLLSNHIQEVGVGNVTSGGR